MPKSSQDFSKNIFLRFVIGFYMTCPEKEDSFSHGVRNTKKKKIRRLLADKMNGIS
jgi:hypothetical protein